MAPSELPIVPYLPEIVGLLLGEGSLVLAAEPGAGKTSLVPQAVAEAIGATADSKVLLMEPRRVAAVSAAARIAELWQARLGLEVGYRVRGDSRSSPGARIEALTPGVLIRMIQGDPGLDGVGCVILDEFHERSAQADLALALLIQARALRPGLRVLAMSATMDARPAAAALGAPVLEVPGRAYPIATRHSPIAEGRPGDGSFEDAFARAALGLIEETEGDVLAFLPGVAEISRAAARFSSLASRGGGQGVPEAVALHGSLPLEDQRRVILPPPGAPRRAIFATSVAETSLTVPRVSAVLDSGLARLSRFQSRAGMNRLVTEREAQDRADQRRGRAGRLGPGTCVRAWPASERLATRTEPELLRAELSSLVLEAAIWGAPRRLDLPWLDPPPESSWSSATELLTELGALSADLTPTDFGRRMASLGTEPRLAALVLRGANGGELWTACLAAALLGERERALSSGDFAGRVEELARMRGGGALAEAERLAKAAGGARESRVRTGALGTLLASAFPDRIGAREEYRGTEATFRVPAGRALRAFPPLAQAEWIVALEADAGAAVGKVYSAFPLSETEALAALELQATETRELGWKGLLPRVSVVRRAGSIVLGRRPAERLAREELAALLAGRLAAEGLGILPWSEASKAVLARLRFFARGRGAEYGLELSDESLASGAQRWLGPYIDEGGGPLLDGPALARAVAALLPRQAAAMLDREAPESISLPSGSTKRIDYSGPGGPAVEARVQEFFGLAQHPTVMGQSLVLRLLDPGGKPLQVTSDLPGFWRGSWAQARKELRGRYPKHEWPVDPAAAAPSRSGVRRSRF